MGAEFLNNKGDLALDKVVRKGSLYSGNVIEAES